MFMWLVILPILAAVLSGTIAYVKVKKSFSAQLNAANDLLEQQQQQLLESKQSNQDMQQKNADLLYQLGECKKDLASLKR